MITRAAICMYLFMPKKKKLWWWGGIGRRSRDPLPGRYKSIGRRRRRVELFLNRCGRWADEGFLVPKTGVTGCGFQGRDRGGSRAF